MAITPQKRRAIVDRENALRDSFWPDASERIWLQKSYGGFVAVPKTMPYVCRILDEMSKDHPLGETYQALWSFTWGNNAFLRVNKPDEVAFAAGFSGQRGRRTLFDRIKRLEALSFIEVQPSGNDRYGFILIPNPHAIIFAHQRGDGPNLLPDAAKGLTTHVMANSFNDFLARALELGGKDVKALVAEVAEKAKPKAKAPKASRKTRGGKLAKPHAASAKLPKF